MNGIKKITIGSIFFAIYFCYILFVLGVEWFNFIALQIGIHLRLGISEVIVIIAIAGYIFFEHNFFVIKNNKLNLQMIMAIMLILFIGFFFSTFPDGTFDTYNYHLIAQNPQFENFFVDDLGQGNFQVWGFRLSDRMFYYFRLILGFRFGTFLNTLIMIIAFIQIYYLLEELSIKKNNSFIGAIITNKAIWAVVILFPLDSILMFGTYYVDAIPLPIALEILRIIFDSDDSQSINGICYFAFLNGLWIGCKLTNVIYVIPCVLIYIIMHLKDFKIKAWISSIVAGVIPSFIYLCYNFMCTGNPVFPYYNSIFKSPYFSESDFKDLRWGPVSITEKVFWSLYAAFRPEYKQSEIIDNYPATLQIGIIGAVLIVVINLYNIGTKKTLNKKLNIMIAFLIVASELWAFTTGYSRYFLFGKILWGLLAFAFVNTLVNSKIKLLSWGGLGCTIYIIVCMVLNTIYVINGNNWSCQKLDVDSFKSQLKYVFRDRDITINYNVDVDLFVLTSNMVMGIAELLDDEVYVININYPFPENFDKDSVFKDKLVTAHSVSDIHGRAFDDVKEYCKKINALGFYISDIKQIMTGAGEYELIYLEADGEKENVVWDSSDNGFALEKPSNQTKYNLSFMAGRFYAWKDSTPITVLVYAISEKQKKEIGRVKIDNNSINKYSVPINLCPNEDIEIEFIYENGQSISENELNKAFIVNAQIE